MNSETYICPFHHTVYFCFVIHSRLLPVFNSLTLSIFCQFSCTFCISRLLHNYILLNTYYVYLVSYHCPIIFIPPFINVYSLLQLCWLLPSTTGADQLLFLLENAFISDIGVWSHFLLREASGLKGHVKAPWRVSYNI